MNKKQFSFSAIMSVMAGRLMLCKLDEYYSLINFLTGEITGDIFSEGDRRRSIPILRKQLPQLKGPKLSRDITKLSLLLNHADTKYQGVKEEILVGWLVKMSAKYKIGINTAGELNKPLTITQPENATPISVEA